MDSFLCGDGVECCEFVVTLKMSPCYMNGFTSATALPVVWGIDPLVGWILLLLLTSGGKGKGNDCGIWSFLSCKYVTYI